MFAKPKPIQTSLVLLSVLFLVLWLAEGCGRSGGGDMNTTTSTSTPKTITALNCAYATNKDILDAITNEIENIPSLRKEEWQYNIFVHETGGTKIVEIMGWSANKLTVEKIASTVVTGCTLDSTNFRPAQFDPGSNYRVQHQCNPGYVPCGDVCIPANESCRLTGYDGSTAATPTATATATPTPGFSNTMPTANSNSNANK